MDSLNSTRGKPVLNDSDLFRVNIKAVYSDNKAEVFSLSNAKLALLKVYL